MKKEIDDKTIKNSIEYVLTWEILISMLVYFNNIKELLKATENSFELIRSGKRKRESTHRRSKMMTVRSDTGTTVFCSTGSAVWSNSRLG